MRDSSAARPRRLKTLLMAVIASAVAASALSAGTAQAATVTVFPNNPAVSNCYPFGRGAAPAWRPYAAFIYQNVPSFELNIGDTLAFDLGAVNDADIELDIALARTVTNGTVVEGEPFQTVVTNNQTPLNPRGDTTLGNFELRFSAEAPFSFPGGGLIIRFTNPSTSYAADATCTQVLVHGNSTDTSAFFVRRAFGDPDGLAPWTPFDQAFIGAFEVVTADPTPPPPPPDPLPPPDAPVTSPGPPLTLDLTARRQRLRKRLTFFARSSADSSLVATGRAIRRATRQLVANQRTRVRATLKPKVRRRLARRLNRRGRARTKVLGTATDQRGRAANDQVVVRFRR